MIITRKWLQEFIDISKISTEDICKTLNSIGLEVDSVEKILIPNDVVVGKVLSKEKHPDADKLNVCQVDLGSEQVQIVCGAKNVDAGQFVPVAKVGCILGDDFKIKKAKLRGLESLGMICSTTEIGLPKLNDGILELDDSIGELILGKDLNEYGILNDDIIEIELTANRGDCLSIHGVAREIGAYYGIACIDSEKEENSNDIGIGQVFELSYEGTIDSDVVYKAYDLENFTMPMITKLRAGIIDKFDEKNNTKTLLNYITHSTGVILNAYSKENIQIDDKASLTVSKDQYGFDIIKNGENTMSTIGVDLNDTKPNDEKYIIEASYINPDLLSKKVFETKTETGDVYYRSSRGSEPDLDFGLEYLTSFISKNNGFVYNSFKSNIEETPENIIDVNIRKVNSIIGQIVTKAEIENILTSLGFDVKDNNEEVLAVTVPKYRHDIVNIADITEEIVRMIGIDNIKSKPLKIDEVNRNNKTSADLQKKNRLRFKAIENGFYETLTYVFSSKESLEKYSFKTVKEELDILNPIVKELNTFRSTILLNLVEACSSNFKNGIRSNSFFEIGTIFDENRNESKMISFVQTGSIEQEDITNSGKPQNIDFFAFAKKILNTVGKFDLEPMQNITNDFIHPYQNADVIVNGKVIGFISKLHPSVSEDYDLSDTFIAEINFDEIKNDLITTQKYSKFQSSKKDLSILVSKDMPYKNIKDAINSLNNQNIKQFNLIDVYNDENLGDNESITIRFVLQNDNKTLEEKDITTTMDAILEVLNEKLDIQIR
ncbi:MAG: phenylalanine--tRNA ligase subunit beta [Sulfurovum sp.]|jgi:phenylalanyl-tRNA synthetase beta chain